MTMLTVMGIAALILIIGGSLIGGLSGREFGSGLVLAGFVLVLAALIGVVIAGVAG